MPRLEFFAKSHAFHMEKGRERKGERKREIVI